MASTEPIPRTRSAAKRSRTPLWGFRSRSRPRSTALGRPEQGIETSETPLAHGPKVSFYQVLSKARRSAGGGRPVCVGFR